MLKRIQLFGNSGVSFWRMSPLQKSFEINIFKNTEKIKVADLENLLEELKEKYSDKITIIDAIMSSTKKSCYLTYMGDYSLIHARVVKNDRFFKQMLVDDKFVEFQDNLFYVDYVYKFAKIINITSDNKKTKEYKLPVGNDFNTIITNEDLSHPLLSYTIRQLRRDNLKIQFGGGIKKIYKLGKYEIYENENNKFVYDLDTKNIVDYTDIETEIEKLKEKSKENN